MRRAFARATAAVFSLVLVPLVAASAPSPKPDIDALFPTLAAQGNAAELDMAHLALERSQVDEVRGFAQKMIDEHTDLGMRLERAAPTAERATPRLNPIDRVAYARLAELPAADFDQEYVVQQIGDHLATMSVFESEARDGKNPALKAFATHELPTIEAHLQLAVIATKHVGGATPFFQH